MYTLDTEEKQSTRNIAVMEKGVYTYLFPYEKIRQGESVLIYGAGLVGMEYLKQLEMTHYCNVIGFADKNYSEYDSLIKPVYAPEEISGLQFDHVVIAQRVGTALQDIRRMLTEYGVADEKIVYVPPREEAGSLMKKTADRKYKHSYAYESHDVSIAVHIAGGIGDYIVQKRLIMELIQLFPGCGMDLYYTRAGKFLNWLYLSCQTVNAIVPDMGVDYNEHVKNYALGIDILSMRYVHINIINEDKLRTYERALEKMKLYAKEISKDTETDRTLPYVLYQRRIYKGLDAYTFQGYGIFDLQDKQIDIPLTDFGKSEFERLNIRNYITINCDFGVSGKEAKGSKLWPMSYFEQLCVLFKNRYPEVAIIQLDDKNICRIQGVDSYLLGESFDMVAYVLKESILHIGIEGGLVHLASQLGTKCAVLFGPTQKKYFSYNDNINISFGSCQGCFGLYYESFRCARGMDFPVCMYGITPAYVMECLKSYMDCMREKITMAERKG